MNRIIILFKLAIVAIPFYLLGCTLHYFFRHIPLWLNSVIYLGLTVGAIYFIYQKRKKLTAEGFGDDLPDYLHQSSYIYVVIAAIIGNFLSASSYRTTLVIDNGRDTAVEVSIKSEETLNIAPHSYATTSLATGPNEISFDGKSKTIEVTDKGKWLFNIDSINTYILTSVNYSNEVELFKNGQIDSTKLQSQELKFIKGELINVETDYFFKAPESITVNKNDSPASVSRQVLYRLGDE